MAGAMASAMLRLRRASPAWRFVIAAALILVAFTLRVAVGGWETGHAYVAFLPVIVLGTLLLGVLPGLATAAMGWLLGVYFFVEPARTLAVADPGDLALAVLFPAICAFAVVAVEVVRSIVGNDGRR
jgi:K+-sensing histidine kinase KdpD